jgi:hypothetical protein
MERLTRSFSFWTLMLAVVALLPATLQANKIIYKAKVLSPTGSQVGSSIYLAEPGKTEISAGSNARLAGNQVQKVVITDGNWQIALCENGGPVQDDCEYESDGRLKITVALTSSMMINAVNGPVTGAQLKAALEGGAVSVVYLDGVFAPLGSGAFVQVFPEP